MNRFLLSAILVLGVAGPNFAQQSDTDKLQGTWELTALLEDGAVVPDDLVRTRYAQYARFTISGQSINFWAPGTLQKRSILFVIDEKVSPKAIDLGGAVKVSGKGIYVLAGDVLMICIGEPEAKQRPTEFSAKKDSPYLLMTLQRVKASEVKANPQPPTVVAPVAPVKENELRKALLGTWGHQDDDWVTMFTLNTDGTFSSSRSFKKKFGRLFHEDVRSSGTWKLQEGVVICNITASTDNEVRNQIFSYRIRSISATELIAIDQFGKLRREWKVP